MFTIFAFLGVHLLVPHFYSSLAFVIKFICLVCEIFRKDTKYCMANNEEDSEISKVLFELASNRRASILLELEKQNLKMQQIVKSLDMTTTETFRHLQRLGEAKLVEKNTDGAYSITSLGNLATGFLSSFNFILKNGDYFLEHDVSCLPYEFVNRLGELSAGEFCGDTLATMNRVRKMVYSAEKCIW